MAGKLTVQGLKVSLFPSKLNTDIFIDGTFVTSVPANQSVDIPITKNCLMSIKVGANQPKETLQIEDGMHTVVQITLNRASSKFTMNIQEKELFSDDNAGATKPVYNIKGVRGRNMRVYEDKVVITTDVTIGSIFAHNATDGEKTIYYSDVLGVQYKRANITIGYLQFETASSSMNNRADNFWNENSFTFGETNNAEMDSVALFVKKKIDEAKKQKNAPVLVTGAVSAADELKKFKELLDMGIITQEEFDAKKKQLLGL